MRNNTRGLIIHIFVGIIIFFIAYIINLSKIVSSIVYGNLIFRLIICLIPIILYYNFSKIMTKKRTPKLDYLNGNLIILLAIILFLPAFLASGFDIFKESVASNAFKFPFEIFLTPQIYVIKVLNIPYNLLTVAIATLAPTFIYGLSIRISREKISKRQRYMRNTRKRYER